MHRLFAPIFAILLPALALATRVTATSPARPGVPVPAPAVPFEKYALPNGLEVILHEDRSLPLVAVNVWYHVGPANEPAKRSGFAHLFEHLMFEGSKHVGKEFDRLLESAGGTNVNGTTSWDRTNYFETVPREHLELVLWIESDRMAFTLETLTPERLDVQRGVVKNERRQSYEDAPYGPSELAKLDTLFPDGHPYHGAVIGSMADLSAATMDDVREFHRAYYAPSNATIVIAGDFASEPTRGLIAKYFGPLPKRDRPPRRKLVTPALTKPGRIDVREPVDLAAVEIAWIAPPAYDPIEAPLDLAMEVLTSGKATRMYQELVVKKKVASEVSSEVDSNELATVASVSAVASTGTEPVVLEKAMDEVLARFASEGPTPEELDRAKKGIRLGYLSDLQLLNGGGGEAGRAGMLQRVNHYLGDPGKLAATIDRYEAVTAEDVKRAVAEVLVPARLVVTTLPTKAER